MRNIKEKHAHRIETQVTRRYEILMEKGYDRDTDVREGSIFTSLEYDVDEGFYGRIEEDTIHSLTPAEVAETLVDIVKQKVERSENRANETAQFRARLQQLLIEEAE